MDNILNQLNNSKGYSELRKISRGIERECLRLDNTGVLAQTTHPIALGSAFCHPYITTDFSEALLEFVTPVFNDIDKCLEFLRVLHQFTYNRIDDELIWMNSMPCILPGVTKIPIAQYGISNAAQMKNIYRRGLSNRYGSAMQTISGIHYNFSVTKELQQLAFNKPLNDEQTSDLYIAATRNFHRHCWLLLYLYGASPAVCKSFLTGNDEHRLETFDAVSYYGKYATSLRMSDLGYRNVAQSRIKINLDNINNYIDSLATATEQSYPCYEKIGVKVDGEYKQLNTNLLQIENEYYTVIRPKQITRSGEKPSVALRNRGLGYIEVRCMDINPNSPLGISDDQIRFVDTLLLFCLFDDSPLLTIDESERIRENRNRIVEHGRDPNLRLVINNTEANAQTLMLNILNQLIPIAKLLDDAHDNHLYSDTLNKQLRKVLDISQTPSAKIINEMRKNDESFFEYAMRKTLTHKEDLKQPLDRQTNSLFESYAADSIELQKTREDNDSLNFDEYLANYFNETLETS